MAEDNLIWKTQHECNYAIMAQLSSIEIGITRMVTFEPSRVHEAHLPQISG
ncbi:MULTISPECIES: hypothetical protein [Acidithiobacillus]|jgi:hypothetical protein|uniref:hypothetical protein n=1 Tax=Acidithiobacillus TaxID=119977 RepID=UPI00017F7354|nr:MULTISPECIES: hypothetical protein [Acidithiobacillus]EGQ62624.1 hypothetical protein GGI1_13994 [Acidithiobacillus sp. GGI-221]MCL5957424.1 hypothetical protein [Gammaproteobacteria bacterium]ACH84590.1 hypothetical protein Lferr_2390 [Acidithiobacillus ferrooxidans ATCC 53993]MBN6745017.1 hypothetical protein [Acidithiobacillus sp. MC2.2]MBN6747934.1 hypothetical protein [Acidithiobacillus sp. PG05]